MKSQLHAIYSGTSVYDHLTSKVTSPIRSPSLGPKLLSTVVEDNISLPLFTALTCCLWTSCDKLGHPYQCDTGAWNGQRVKDDGLIIESNIYCHNSVRGESVISGVCFANGGSCYQSAIQ